MLNKDFVLNKWIPALRSGEFEQAQNSLHVVDSEGEHSYCCLGVAACFIDSVEWVDEENVINGAVNLKDEFGTIREDVLSNVSGNEIGLYDGHFVPIPESLITQETFYDPLDDYETTTVEFFYRGESLPVISYYDECSIDIAELNDEGWTFEQIADLLEYIANAI